MAERKPIAPPPQEQDGWFKSIVEHLNVGVFVSTLEGRLRYVNPATVRLSGHRTQEEVEGLEAKSLYAIPSDRERLVATLSRDGQVHDFETESLRADGSRYPVSLSAALLRDEAGAPSGVLGIVEDITARRQAEGELALLKHSIDTDPTPWYWFDPGGRLLSVNAAGCKCLGYTRDELLRLEVQAINPRATPERWREVWQQIKAAGTLQLESEHRRKDGSTFPVKLTSTYFRQGEREYCNGVAVDLTDRRRAEEEQRRLRARLGEAERLEAIGRLAGGVAHDFNNMLGVILGNAALALRQLDPASKAYTFLAEIQTAAERSAGLTRQLLAFARKQTAQPRVLDLNEAIGEQAGMLQRLVGDNVALVMKSAPALPKVLVDPSQLSQVLTNLCLNARDSIESSGTIVIETAHLRASAGARAPDVPPGDYVRISVTDTGCGMTEEVLAHLFEPFFTTKALGKGTGLGLATVYGIVRQSGGYIEARSQVGKGTTFDISLPVADQATAVATTREVLPEPPRGRETVLLVEDEPALLRTTQRVLEGLGYEVLVATSATEALRALQKRAGGIALLVSDVVMPEMSGLELADRAIAIRPELRLLLISGYPSDVVAQRGVVERGLPFLAKPFLPQELAQRVAEVLSHPPAAGGPPARRP